MGSNRMKDYELTIKVQLSAPAEIDSSSLRDSIMSKLAACISAEVGKFTFYHDQQVLLAEVGAMAEDGSEVATGEPWGASVEDQVNGVSGYNFGEEESWL